MKNIRKTLQEYTILLVLIAILAFFHHAGAFRNGFDLLPGDEGDALLNVLAADSWGDVFRGESGIRQNRMYYPFPAGRGFTDLSLTLYLLELPWRIVFNCDMFTSAKIVYLLLHGFGICSMFYLLRKVLHFRFIPALGGAVLSFYSNAAWVKLQHTQFFFIGLLPLLAIFAIRYFQLWNTNRKKRRLYYGMGAILVFAWIAYSNYYTAFFAGLFTGVFLLTGLIWQLRQKKFSGKCFCQQLPELGVLLVWGGLLFAPFFYIYAPLISPEYSREWSAAQGTLPTPADILNTGPNNLLWGRLYDLAFPPVHKYVYENYHGLPLLTFALLLCCIWIFFKKRKTMRPVYTVLFLSLAVVYLLSLKVAHGVSLWYLIWKWLPGGSAIRAGGRLYVFLIFPLTVFLWLMIDRFSRKFAPRKRLIFCTGILLLLVLDNFNTMDIYNWNRTNVCARLQDVPPPPPGMRCFYLTDSAPGTPSPGNWHFYGLTAWLYARHFQSFTLNGYSGNAPAGFEAFDPQAPEYTDQIRNWIQTNKMDGIYHFDLSKRQWNKDFL